MKNGKYTLMVAPSSYPGPKYRGRYAYEHRVVFWQEYGYLPEVVHHDNEIKTDNLVNNLLPATRPEHTAHHNQERGGHSYRNGCRCEECRTKQREAQRAWRKSRIWVGATRKRHLKGLDEAPSGHTVVR